MLDGLGKVARIFSGLMTIKAESDYWNGHSDSYKMQVILQTFFGVFIALAAYWSYMNNPVGTPNSTVPVLIFFDYLCICWALNSQRSLNERSFKSDNFSEFWKFGFFKGDDFMAGIIFGWLLAALLSFGIFDSLVLHHTIPIDIGKNSTAASSVVHSSPAAQVTHPAVKHDSHPAHKAAAAHHNAASTHAHPAAVQ